MKKSINLIIFILFFSLVNAQNNLPQVSINSTVVDTVNKTIHLNFDAIDVDNDALEIKVLLSADSGVSFVAAMQNISGDIGYPITQGINKSATITYQADSLFYAANANISAWFMVKIVVSDKKHIAIEDMILPIDSALVYHYMQYIAQPRHHTAAPAGLSLIKDSIEVNFNRFNLQTQRSSFNFSTYGGENIIGRKPGLMQEKNTIIVDAHFDAVANSPGADDNGSSLAAVLIASKILAPYQFEKTLNFIGFDKEENGLLGSAYYVNNSIPSYQQTEAVLNMEMIGYYSDAPNSQSIPAGFSQLFPIAVDSINTGGNKGVWLFAVGNTNSAALSMAFDTIARNYVPDVKSLVLTVPGNGQIAPDLRRSDHASFWDAGFKGLMLTDGADFRNANYHTPGDSLGTLNIPFLVRNIKAITATAAVLAQPISANAAVAGAWQLIKDIPFSIDEKNTTVEVEVYPNPTQEELYIKFNKNITNVQVKLENAAGKIVAHQALNNVKQNSTVSLPIHVSVLASGIYYLTATSSDFNCVKKIVISQAHKH